MKHFIRLILLTAVALLFGCETDPDQTNDSGSSVGSDLDAGMSSETTPECTDGDTQVGTSACGLNQEGFFNQDCADGSDEDFCGRL